MGLFKKTKRHEQAPPEISLDQLPFDDLLERKVALDDAIKRRGSTEIDGFINRFQALASSLGVSVGSIFGIREPADDRAPKERKKRETRPKYRDPETGETWSGKGHAPQWMKAFLEAGRDKSEFLIEKETA